MKNKEISRNQQKKAEKTGFNPLFLFQIIHLFDWVKVSIRTDHLVLMKLVEFLVR